MDRETQAFGLGCPIAPFWGARRWIDLPRCADFSEHWGSTRPVNPPSQGMIAGKMLNPRGARRRSADKCPIPAFM
jgi:hypothetical protein